MPSQFINPFKDHLVPHRRTGPKALQVVANTGSGLRADAGGGGRGGGRMAVAEPSTWEMHATLSTTVMLTVILNSNAEMVRQGTAKQATFTSNSHQ